MATQREKLEAEYAEKKASLEAEFERAKAKWYAKPAFAFQVGTLLGVVGTLLVQWIV